MAKLDIGVGQEFPIEEKPHAEDRGCSRRDHHHHHHHFHHHKEALREMWRRHFGRGGEQKKDKE